MVGTRHRVCIGNVNAEGRKGREGGENGDGKRMSGRFTKEGSDEGACMRQGACDGGKEGVPLRVVYGALCFLTQGVSVRTEGDKTNPRRFLYK